MATNTKTALATRPATPAPKSAPSPAQQAFRQNVLAKRANTAPAPRKVASTAPSMRPEKETLGKVIGGEANTLIAGVGLGAVNASQIGQAFEKKLNVKASRAVAGAAVLARLFGIDSAVPILQRGGSAIIKSELNDLARTGGETGMALISKLLDGDKPTETKVETPANDTKTETKVETKADNGIEVKEKVSNGVNGAASHATQPKVTHEKNPSANA